MSALWPFSDLVGNLTEGRLCAGFSDACMTAPSTRTDGRRPRNLHRTAQRGLVPAFNVLFLGTRNAARSIIVEALLRRIGAGHRPSPTCAVGGRLCLFSTEWAEFDQGFRWREKPEAACSANHPHFLLIAVEL
jgi:hypothetical protein